jgi:hypothetical protein
MQTIAKLVAMSAVRGRERRQDNTPTVLFQTRVNPDFRAALHRAADRSGVSLALYMDVFIRSALDENGELPDVSVGRRHQDLELPISDVA